MRLTCLSSLAILALSGIAAPAAVRDTMQVGERLAERDAFADQLFGCVSSVTPVSYIDRYDGPLTVLSAAFVNAHSSAKPTLLSSDTRIVGEGCVRTFLPIKESRLWGRLDYDDGRHDNVGSNLTADAGVVWPFVMADTTTKRIHHSCLKVGAGYARDLDNWAVGIDLFCAATHESRKSDVGPSNFSCDMKATLGFSYLLPRYRLGISLGGRKYSQDNDKSPASASDTPTSHLLGLWTDMEALRGVSDETSYSGKGFSLGLHLTPKRGEAWYASALFSRMTFDKDIEMPYGSLTLASGQRRELLFEVGHTLRQSSFLRRIELEFGVDQRRGGFCRLKADNTLETEASADGDYDADCPHLWLTMAAVSQGMSVRNDFGLRLGFAKWRERTTQPSQRMENEAVRMRLMWGCLVGGQRLSLRPELTLAADIALDQKLSGEPTVAADRFLPVSTMVQFLRNNRAFADIAMRIGFEVSDGLCLALTPSGHLATHSDGENVTEFRLRLSAIF